MNEYYRLSPARRLARQYRREQHERDIQSQKMYVPYLPGEWGESLLYGVFRGART